MTIFSAADEKTAEKLFQAYVHKQQLAKDQIPASLDKQQAYGIQHALTAKKIQYAGEELKGYKVSLTSQETQKLFNSTTPLYGALMSSALSDGIIELDGMASPLIEIELIFIALEDLSPTDSIADILQKTMVSPGIEVPDSRFDDWFPKITLGQVIADSAVAGKIVSGAPVSSVSYEGLADIQGVLRLNGQEIASNSSTAVLGHPALALKWLVDELAHHGTTLKKGMYVSSGTFISPKKLERGHYTASYEGIGEVALEVI
ncbi:MAG TPA: hydratase [Planococcus sp. (in: firmicutes)]|nr:hydratase [Planococcus sp. (in: firmicutes)]